MLILESIFTNPQVQNSVTFSAPHLSAPTRLLPEAANTFCGVGYYRTSIFYDLYSNNHEMKTDFQFPLV